MAAVTKNNRLCKLEKRGDEIFKKSSLKLLSKYNFERGPPKDHFSKVWVRLAQ
jgi:hypothetical protein